MALNTVSSIELRKKKTKYKEQNNFVLNTDHKQIIF
ncbi:hypothetical protein ES705_19996 [subsurface metagenome]